MPADMPEARWRLRGLKLRKVDRVAAGDNPAARVLLAKAFPATDPTVPPKTQEDRMPDLDLDALPDDVKSAFGDMQTQLADTQAKLAQAEGADTATRLVAAEAELVTAKEAIQRYETEKAEFEKAVGHRPEIRRDDLPEDVRKALDEADAAREQAKAMEQRIAKMERDSRHAGLVAKASTDYPHLPATAAELADILTEAGDKLDTDTVKRIETLFKATSAQLDKSKLFAEMGSRGAPNEGRTAFDAEVEKARQANPSMSRADLIASVMKSRPDLAQAVDA